MKSAAQELIDAAQQLREATVDLRASALAPMDGALAAQHEIGVLRERLKLAQDALKDQQAALDRPYRLKWANAAGISIEGGPHYILDAALMEAFALSATTNVQVVSRHGVVIATLTPDGHPLVRMSKELAAAQARIRELEMSRRAA
jgi:hypothetical protein